jgi:hypothetical protein
MGTGRRTILGLVIFSLMAVTPLSTPLGSVASSRGAASASGGCVPGAAYDPSCDVDRSGLIDVVDIMLVAGHWRDEGTWTSDSPQNVVLVAKSGGDYTSIQDALDGITDASAGNRYLVWVAPGTYTETVVMKSYVDIEGAGELATKITYTGFTLPGLGTVVGTDDVELRFLTVENTGGHRYATAIRNHTASPRLTHVTASASGGESLNCGVYNNYHASSTMTHVTASASGGTDSYGVYNRDSSPTMTDVAASASDASDHNYGIRNDSSSPTMTDVSASASGGTDSYGVYNVDGSSPTMTDVAASASDASDHNYGIHNDSSSPTMTDVIASASGGYGSYGVYNRDSSSPTMTHVTASASGGSYAYGVFNQSASPTMKGITASGSGGMFGYGVYNYDSSATIKNSVISGSGGTYNFGIYNVASSGTHTVTVNNCQITGSTNTIDNGSEFTTLVGASLLDGGAVSGGDTVTCAGVYDENYTFYASACP